MHATTLAKGELQTPRHSERRHRKRPEAYIVGARNDGTNHVVELFPRLFTTRECSRTIGRPILTYTGPVAINETFPNRVLPFQFAGRRITVPDLLEATLRVLSILKDVDVRATGQENGSLDWVIKDMRYGSAVIEIYAEPKGENTPFGAAETVVDRFRSGMRHIIETGERPEYFSEYAMRRVSELTAILDENGIQAFRFGTNGDSFELKPSMRKSVRSALEGRYRSLGSVEGQIDSLSAHEEPFFCTVYTSLTNEPVRCFFSPALLSDVYENFRRRVTVHGLFTTRADGEVTSMRASRIEPFPSPNELPTVDDIIGIFSNGD